MNQYIEHTLLKQDATKAEIKKLLDEAIEYKFLGVCVNPCYVKYASDYNISINEEELNVPNELIGKLYTKQSKNYFATTKERIADAKKWLKENKMEAVLIEE